MNVNLLLSFWWPFEVLPLEHSDLIKGKQSPTIHQYSAPSSFILENLLIIFLDACV